MSADAAGEARAGRLGDRADLRPRPDARAAASPTPSGPSPSATRLGWQLEANWTDPFLFFIYSVAKPVSSALILVVMLEVIGGPAGQAFRPFVIVGSALWAFVISGVAGLAWSILEDRERYRVLKYVYVSPGDFLTVLVGSRRGPDRRRGWPASSSPSSSGSSPWACPSTSGPVDWPLLVASSVLGLGAHHRPRAPHGRRLHPDTPGVVELPGGLRGSALPRHRRGLPAHRPARRRSRPSGSSRR